jgi:hypothetical protein
MIVSDTPLYTNEPGLTICEHNPNPEINFMSGKEVMLRLTKEGFHYQGKVIHDHGEAYDLFRKWLATTTKY